MRSQPVPIWLARDRNRRFLDADFSDFGGTAVPRFASCGILLCSVTFGIAAGAEPTAAPPMPRLPFDAERAQTLRAEWARAFRLEAACTNSVGMKLVLIPGGRFEM